MPPKKQLSTAFPHRCILGTSIALCVCGLATITLASVGLAYRILGYYWATGFWCGAIIVITGSSGIVLMLVRDICSAKAFMISSICGGIASLAMTALSACGVDPTIDFYDSLESQNLSDAIEMMIISYIVHGACLGIGIIQLTLCILSDGICFFYLFVEKGTTMFRVKDNKGHRNKNKHSRGRTSRHGSASSRRPLCDNAPSKVISSQKKGKSKTECKQTKPQSARRQSATSSRRQSQCERDVSPTRNSFVRSASFSTFGHRISPERESLIVHPGDDMSVADTCVSRATEAKCDTENHYAQTALFEPPLPIEEDEHLPPYELVDSNPYENVENETYNERNRRRNRRDAEKPTTGNTHGRRTDNQTNRQRTSRRHPHSFQVSSRTRIPHGRLEEAGSNDELERATHRDNATNVASVKHSRSADILDAQSESVPVTSDNQILASAHSQGVLFRDFARTNDAIQNLDGKSRSFRSQSVRVNREKRMEKRKRALSAEIRLNKEQIFSQGQLDQNMSAANSNPGLFADNRVKPTKFSLRTPVRQIGMPVLRSLVPICSITSLPLFSPPTKPPRIHSYTTDDFKIDVSEIELDAAEGEECPFIDEIDNTETKLKQAKESDNRVSTTSSKKTSIPSDECTMSDISPCVSLTSGPVVELKGQKGENVSIYEILHQGEKELVKPERPCKNVASEVSECIELGKISNVAEQAPKTIGTSETASFMELPISPTVKKVLKYPKPQVRRSKLTSTADRNNAPNTETGREKGVFNGIINTNNIPVHDNSLNDKKYLISEDMNELKVRLPPIASISKSSTDSLSFFDRRRAPHNNSSDGSHNATSDVPKNNTNTTTTNELSSYDIKYKGARPKTSFRKPVDLCSTTGVITSKTSRLNVLDASPPHKVNNKHTPLTSELTLESRQILSLSHKVQCKPVDVLPLAPSNTKTGSLNSEITSAYVDIKSPLLPVENTRVVNKLEPNPQASKDTQLVLNNSLGLRVNENNKQLSQSQVPIQSLSSKFSKPQSSSTSSDSTPPPPAPTVRTSGVQSRPIVRTRPSTVVPVLSSKGGVQGAHAQGVSHLPQSQHSRRVTDTGSHTLNATIQPQRVQQNHVQQNLSRDPNRPLFSVLL